MSATTIAKRVYYSDFYDANGKRHRRRHPNRPEAIAATIAGRAEAAALRAKAAALRAASLREKAKSAEAKAGK